MVDSKDKGNRGERQALKLLEKWWGSEFAKTPSSGGFKTKKFRDDWNAEGDIVTPDETFPFSVEVKWQENWYLDQLLTAPKNRIWEWWEQAKGQTSPGKFTLLIFKKNRQDFFIMIKDEDEHDLLQSAFVANSSIRVIDRQEEVAYIRLFKDLLKEPKDVWARKPKKR